MKLYHHSRSMACRNPVGSIPAKSAVTLRLLGASKVKEAKLRLWDGKEAKLLPMKKVDDAVYEIILTPEEPGLLWYDFRVKGEDGIDYAYGNAPDCMGGEGALNPLPPSFQITVYDPHFKTPDYMHHGIMYQIFPDRFHRSKMPVKTSDEQFIHENWYDTPMVMPEGKENNVCRDFFGGDLKGITEKLPDLAEMGITILYLNPIFKARSNHRYDTGDYMQVDPMLGDEDDLKNLCEKAHELGIRIILDGVFSHTGEDSVYFNRFGRYNSVGAYQSKKSPYYEWYNFKKYPDEYNCWWGFKTLPTVNKKKESYQKFICGKEGVARKWLRDGVTGWRLDVADELPMDFLRRLRKSVRKEGDDRLLLGEVWEDASHKVSYGEMRCYCTGDTLDSVMNYPLREVLMNFLLGTKSARDAERLILSQQENYPAPFYYALMNLLGSHDRARMINTLAGREFNETAYQDQGKCRLNAAEYSLGRRRYLQMLKVICALPGTPCIYYGDEAGMYGANDPYCRGPYPWGKEDQEMKKAVKKILQERIQSPALRTGFMHVIAPDNDTLIIIRTIENGRDVFGQPFPNETKSLTISRRCITTVEVR